MPTYRLSHTAQADVASILRWSEEHFGYQAREAYEALLVAGLRDASTRSVTDAALARPDLGEGVFIWHLSLSRPRGKGGVGNPRHLLVCRKTGDILVVGRVLHDAMDLKLHVDVTGTWE